MHATSLVIVATSAAQWSARCAILLRTLMVHCRARGGNEPPAGDVGRPAVRSSRAAPPPAPSSTHRTQQAVHDSHFSISCTHRERAGAAAARGRLRITIYISHLIGVLFQ